MSESPLDAELREALAAVERGETVDLGDFSRYASWSYRIRYWLGYRVGYWVGKRRGRRAVRRERRRDGYR